MKKIGILLLFIVSTITGSAQITEIYHQINKMIKTAELEEIAALENITNAEQAKELNENRKKTKELKKQKERLEELKELTGKVSKAIKKYSVIQSSMEYLKNTLDLYVSLSKRFKKNENMNSKELTELLNILYYSVEAQQECIKNIKTIVNSDKTKMSEAQRIKLLYKEEEKMKLNYNNLKKIEKSISSNRLNYL